MSKGKDQTTIYSNFSQIHRGPKNGQAVTRPWLVHVANYRGNPDFVACQQQRHRPVCASEQYDQSL